MTKPTIGWREWVTLPDLGVDAVKAKIDTGALSSTLHAWHVEVVDDPRAGPVVRFVLHPRQRDRSLTISTEGPLVGWRDVRSSNGTLECRPVIRTPVVIAGRRVAVELTLTRRDEMGFRMLIGRRAVRRRFVIDPARSFAGGGTSVAAAPVSSRSRALVGCVSAAR
jgi:hypothetical protein